MTTTGEQPSEGEQPFGDERRTGGHRVPKAATSRPASQLPGKAKSGSEQDRS